MQISKWVALGVASFCLVAVGGVVNMPHLYYMAAMLLTLPAVSYMFGWFTLRGLEFERHSPSPVWEGEETEITYTVTNRSRFTRFFLAIREPVNPRIESIEMNPSLFSVKARGSTEIRNRVRFDRRGVFNSGSFEVAALDPLGVFTFSRTVSSNDEAVVYPAPRQIPWIDLAGSEQLGWNDAPVFARHGDGVDSSGVRGYLPGDPLRRIHWRQTARTGKLTVIEFDETQSIDLRIVLETGSAGVVGREPNTSLEYAIRAAATIARDSIQQSAMVELVVANRPGRDIVLPWNGLRGERGDNRLYTVLESLARIEPQTTTSLSDLLTKSIGEVAFGATLVVICLNLDRDLPMILANYVASGVIVTMIYVDESSFRYSSLAPYNGRIDPVVARAHALGVSVCTLSCNDEGALQIIPLS